MLNLALLSYMDSSGLGQLVSCHNSLAKTEGGLTLLHVTKRNTALLSMTRLATVFQSTDSEDAALRSFHEDPATPPLASVGTVSSVPTSVN